MLLLLLKVIGRLMRLPSGLRTHKTITLLSSCQFGRGHREKFVSEASVGQRDKGKKGILAKRSWRENVRCRLFGGGARLFN